MVTYVRGDLLESNCNYICHQVNCRRVMNSGIAGQIRNKWPSVFTEYVRKCDAARSDSPSFWLLGQSQLVVVGFDKCVINMFAQEDYGRDGRRYTSYDAFWDCLIDISESVELGASIGFPKGIGCGLGGGNWNVISSMIESVLGEDCDVYIYELET
mgnify:CR=1 FL=1